MCVCVCVCVCSLMMVVSLQNPGFDFSGADISGNYSGGGPRFDNL